MGPSSKPRRQSRAVYRRRRLVLGIIALILIAGIATGLFFGIRWLVIAQPWQNLPFLSSDEPVAAEPEDPVPTLLPGESPGDGDPEPSPTPTEEEPEECAEGALHVVAHTDKKTYEPGEEPQLTVELTNDSGSDCIINVGTSQQRFVIASGADEWWRSTDCQVEPSDHWVTLEAGQNVTTEQPVVWNRTRSSVDTCESDGRPPAVGGGATYTLTVSIGDATSEAATFVLN
ncbi:hypothetical protein [Microbacterium sp. gxy059]|uniref:hypothetical protein n=1 Tax=Microbacterium sp. gxy059 TaxID=2957199 RepID=UPI003D9833AD